MPRYILQTHINILIHPRELNYLIKVDKLFAHWKSWVFTSQKPWMTRVVRMLLKACDTAFRSDDRALYSAARANLKRGIKDDKMDYKGWSHTTSKPASPHLRYTSVCLSNRSSSDAITIALHSTEPPGTPVELQLRFIDYSSAIITIIPDILVTKLSDLGLPTLTCSWLPRLWNLAPTSHKKQGTHIRLQEEQWRPQPPLHQRWGCRESQYLQVLWYPHIRWPVLDC